jgi:hypothetical protein
MERGRRHAWCIMLGGAVLFCAAMVPMAQRIARYNAAAKIPTFHAEPIAGRTLRVDGFPVATLTDVEAADGARRGEGMIRLEYGGRETLIPVKRPPALNLPTLAGYDEWLKALAIYPVVRNEKGEQSRVAGSERFVIVVRRTPEGYDPETWGEVRRIDWVFDYYELTRDGKVERLTRRWPRSYASENRLQREAAGKSEGLTAEQTAASNKLAALEPLKQRTFEYYAAMFVIPKLNVPQYKFTDTAFRPEVLGWTLPGSMISVLLFTGGLIFVIAPARRRKIAAETRTAN